MLIEQAMLYLRECHAHQFSLTRTVVTLNTVTLAAGGLYIKAMSDNTLDSVPGLNIFLIIFGILVALFGIVFNQGASKTHTHLNKTIVDIKRYLNMVLKDTHNGNEFYESVMAERTGYVYVMTKIFFLLCSLIWLALGGMIIYLSIQSLNNLGSM